jgi:hypothetical protein
MAVPAFLRSYVRGERPGDTGGGEPGGEQNPCGGFDLTEPVGAV